MIEQRRRNEIDLAGLFPRKGNPLPGVQPVNPYMAVLRLNDQVAKDLAFLDAMERQVEQVLARSSAVVRQATKDAARKTPPGAPPIVEGQALMRATKTLDWLQKLLNAVQEANEFANGWRKR